MDPEELIQLLDLHFSALPVGPRTMLRTRALEDLQALRSSNLDSSKERSDLRPIFDVPGEYRESPGLWVVLSAVRQVVLDPLDIALGLAEPTETDRPDFEAIAFGPEGDDRVDLVDLEALGAHREEIRASLARLEGLALGSDLPEIDLGEDKRG